VVSAIK
jgi:hypothetical protein